MEKLRIDELQMKAHTIRCQVIKMLTKAGSGHTGGSLSMVDIVTALYFRVLRYDPNNPLWPDRDRFVLSKGHGVPALYATLAEAGYFPVEELMTLREINSRLVGHPSRVDLAGIEIAAGPLGMGLSVALGMALIAQLDKKAYHIYCLVGDGECNEGQIWEAALAANKWNAYKLTAIVDLNRFQLDGATNDIMPMEPFAEKWRAFGWAVHEIDGHNMHQIVGALENAKEQECPTVIIAHTIKGKGVSFIENNNDFHGTAPTAEQGKNALVELRCEEA